MFCYLKLKPKTKAVLATIKSNNDGVAQSSTSHSASTFFALKSYQRQKRPQREKGDSDNGGDDEDRLIFKTPKTQQPEKLKPWTLAFTFWNFDPFKHRECLSRKLHRVTEVK